MGKLQVWRHRKDRLVQSVKGVRRFSGRKRT